MTCSRVAKDTALIGRLACASLDVEGAFEGEVVAAQSVRLGCAGRMHASIRAAAVELAGEFRGDVRSPRLIIRASSQAQGRFSCHTIVVEDGAIVDGHFDDPANDAVGLEEGEAEPSAPRSPDHSGLAPGA
jgi:cytoskeletal protein CcmA (bactofilin family)